VSNTSYGIAFDECVKKGFFPNIDEAQSFEQNIRKLVAGRVDLIINSHDVGQYILKKIRADTAIIALYPPVDVIDSYLAFTRKRDFSSLADDFDRVLANENR
jgi:polar amino acid transport system substrate-binding protein